MARYSLAQGIALVVFGVFWTIVSASIYSACTSIAASAPVTASGSCGPIVAFVLVGILLIVLGAVVIAMGWRSYTYVTPTTDPSVPPPLIRPVVVQQTVQQEVVMVRCRYCGTLSPVDAGKCTGCGAPL